MAVPERDAGNMDRAEAEGQGHCRGPGHKASLSCLPAWELSYPDGLGDALHNLPAEEAWVGLALLLSPADHVPPIGLLVSAGVQESLKVQAVLLCKAQGAIAVASVSQSQKHSPTAYPALAHLPLPFVFPPILLFIFQKATGSGRPNRVSKGKGLENSEGVLSSKHAVLVFLFGKLCLSNYFWLKLILKLVCVPWAQA